MLNATFRINHLHLKGLKAIRELDLPRQGPGWKGQIPDCVMVGGVNGSGKTTLLEFIVNAASYLVVGSASSEYLQVDAATVDFEACGANISRDVFRLAFGDEAYVQERKSENYWGIVSRAGVSSGNISSGKTLRYLGQKQLNPIAPGFPVLIYLPSERALVPMRAKFKAGGKLARSGEFVSVWRPPTKWEESLEAVLYAARWEDLNAREEGRDDDTAHFAQFEKAFAFFCGDPKTIGWHRGELVVEMKNTRTRHDIDALSSGEKQVLLLATELLLRWRPGSLVLIDEPELHLHPAWQVRLWQALVQWQKERGGQVIVVTQSSELFGIAEPGATLLLGGDTL